MLTLAIAACASLLAGAPRSSPAANAHINSTAHAHPSLSETRTFATMTMAAHSTVHTIARRITALNCTLRMIPARMPDCLLDGTMDQEKSWRLSRELFEAQATHSTTEQMLGALQSENEELLARHEQLSGVEARVGILEAELAAARRNEEFAREEAQAARNEAELCREASVSRGDETSYLATELASVKGERDKFAEDAALRADEQQRRIAELQAIVHRLELTRDDLQESLTKERAVTLSYMEESDRQTTRIEQLEAEVAAAPPPGVVREAAHWKQAAGEHLRFRELLLSQMDTYVVQQAQAQRQLEQFGVDFLGTNLLGSGPPAGAASDFGEEMSAGGVHGRGFKCAMGTATMPLT